MRDSELWNAIKYSLITGKQVKPIKIKYGDKVCYPISSTCSIYYKGSVYKYKYQVIFVFEEDGIITDIHKFFQD